MTAKEKQLHPGVFVLAALCAGAVFTFLVVVMFFAMTQCTLTTP